MDDLLRVGFLSTHALALLLLLAPQDVTGCRYDWECPDDSVCVNQKWCVNLCSSSALCGNNAYCISENHVTSCLCKQGFKGNPNSKSGCLPLSGSFTNQTFSSPRAKRCKKNRSCPSDTTCVSNYCVNLCSFTALCGNNAYCTTKNHVTSCKCKQKFKGDPYSRTGCLPVSASRTPVSQDPCMGKCAANAECRIDGRRRVCYCKAGHEGDPYVSTHGGCRPAATHPEPVDPLCVGKCGVNTNCKLFNGDTLCGCKPGFAGNPYDRNVGCQHAQGAVNTASCWGEDRDEPSPECVRYFKNKPKKRFFIFQQEATWFEAQRLCENENQMLAIVENSKEEDRLEDELIYAGLEGKLWLAGSDLTRQGRFKWVAGSTFNTMLYTNWAEDEPDGRGERCVALGASFRWRTEDCTQGNYFVCQQK